MGAQELHLQIQARQSSSLAMVRRSTRTLSIAALAGLLVVATWFSTTFVSPSDSPRVPEIPAARLGTVGGYMAASWLAESQPAFADADNLPGWPYVLVFTTLFVGLFIIPNTFWR